MVGICPVPHWNPVFNRLDILNMSKAHRSPTSKHRHRLAPHLIQPASAQPALACSNPATSANFTVDFRSLPRRRMPSPLMLVDVGLNSTVVDCMLTKRGWSWIYPAWKLISRWVWYSFLCSRREIHRISPINPTKGWWHPGQPVPSSQMGRPVRVTAVQRDASKGGGLSWFV